MRLFPDVIAAGTWPSGAAWVALAEQDIPEAVLRNPKLCTTVGAVLLWHTVVDPEARAMAGTNDLPKVLLTLNERSRPGEERPRLEIVAGGIEDEDREEAAKQSTPESQESPAQKQAAYIWRVITVAGGREIGEEAGVQPRGYAALAWCYAWNHPQNPKYPPRSYMPYLVASIDGEPGSPSQSAHTSRLLTPQEIGRLARLSQAKLETHDENVIAPWEARIIRAALVATGYNKEVVDKALGPLPPLNYRACALLLLRNVWGAYRSSWGAGVSATVGKAS